MIKDSKLIGTKIAAPYGWKKFKVGELFNKQGPIVNRTVADFSISYSEAYRGSNYINCATAGVDNNGCPMIVSRDVVDESDIINNCITVSANGVNTGSVFVQTEDFCVLQDSYALIFKYADVDVDDYLFVASLLSKYRDVFDYQVKAGWARLSELFVEIPVTSTNKPDFEWMSAYIKVVKTDYLEQKELSNQHEIKDYLAAGKVDSMDVTDADRQFLRDFEKLPRRKFKVGELFDFKSSMSLNKADLKFVSKQDPFAIPYITRTVLNNGINGYVDSRLIGDEYINDGGEFAFGLLGLVSFYQCNRYCTGQFVKRFVPKFELNELLAMFFKTLLDKQIELFKTVSIRSYDKLVNDVLDIELPVIAKDEVDVCSIEKYMQIQSKPLINKVAETLAADSSQIDDR